jgi:hypothetical protein
MLLQGQEQMGRIKRIAAKKFEKNRKGEVQNFTLSVLLMKRLKYEVQTKTFALHLQW